MLLVLLCLLAAILAMHIADRSDARRRSPVTFGEGVPLPLWLSRPTKHRHDLAARKAARENR